MATEFSTIEEARQVLEYSQAQTLYLRSHYTFDTTIERLSNFKSAKSGSFFRIFTGVGLWSSADPIRNSPEFVAQNHELKEMYEKWFIAADKLWKRVQGSGSRDFHRLAGRRAVAFFSLIMQSSSTMSETGYDQYLSHFQEMVGSHQRHIGFLDR